MHPENKHSASALTQTEEHADFSLERISQLVSDLEQELSKASHGSPRLHDLRNELDALKHTLSANAHPDKTIEQLHDMRTSLAEFVASVEGEILKDTRYLTELGRILGLI